MTAALNKGVDGVDEAVVETKVKRKSQQIGKEKDGVSRAEANEKVVENIAHRP